MLLVTFRLNGLLGRDVFADRCGPEVDPPARAYYAMEWDMIYEGCWTFECGCCIDPAHTSWDFVSLSVLPDES